MTSNIESYILDLSRELNIENTHGVIGNELELIALVRNCPFLYDKSRNDFKDIEKKEATWKAIASVMHSSVSDCQARWKSLREQYGKIKRHIANKDPDVSRIIQWEFLDDMKFLEEHIKPRRKFKSLSYGNISESLEQEDDNYRIEWLEEAKNYDSRELKLINLVKNCPLLYDKGNFDHRDAAKREQAWLSISKVIGCPVLDCKTRWKTLRERYARERKLQLEDPSRKPWAYYDELSFLDLHVRARKTGFRPILPKPDFTSNFMKTTDSLLANATLADNNYQIQKMEFIDTAYQNCSSAENNDPISMSPNSGISQSNSENSRGETSIKPLNNMQISQDEDDLFGQSIAAELKKITGRRKKMRLKADIFKLFCEAESD